MFSRSRKLFVVAASLFSLMLLGGAGAEKSDAGDSWLTSYDAAAEKAKASGKLMMLDFTGSDWCGYCIALKKEVFTTGEFNQWAAANLVLVEVDFPRRKEMPQDVKDQNKKLQAKFGPRGYPSCIFLTADGKEVGRIVGYGGAKEWTDNAHDIVSKNKPAT